MQNFRKWFVLMIIGSMLLTGTAFARKIEESIRVRFANIQLIVNGKPIATKAEPFIYNGSVYAPVATIANMLGIKQEWDNSTPAVRFSDDLKSEEITMSDRDSGLHLLDFTMALKYRVGSVQGINTFYNIYDRKALVSKEQVVPRIEKAGYLNFVEPITPFIKYTSNETNEFLMSEYLHKEGDNQYWISLFRYDKVKGTLTKVLSQRVDEEQDKGLFFQITVNEMIEVKMYDISQEIRQLVGVKWYTWSENKFIKVEELIK